MKQQPAHLPRHLAAAALLLLGVAPARSEPVATLERSPGARRVEEIRIYLRDGTHLTENITVVPITVRVRISGERPMSESEEGAVLAAAVRCAEGYPRDVDVTREGAGEKRQTWTVVYDCVTPGG